MLSRLRDLAREISITIEVSLRKHPNIVSFSGAYSKFSAKDHKEECSFGLAFELCDQYDLYHPLHTYKIKFSAQQKLKLAGGTRVRTFSEYIASRFWFTQSAHQGQTSQDHRCWSFETASCRPESPPTIVNFRYSSGAYSSDLCCANQPWRSLTDNLVLLSRIN